MIKAGEIYFFIEGRTYDCYFIKKLGFNCVLPGQTGCQIRLIFKSYGQEESTRDMSQFSSIFTYEDNE